MTLTTARTAYLVGIRGVAMTALAACLQDRGVVVSGCDVDEAFVTEPQLVRLGITPTVGFDHQLPTECDIVIYTAAHQGVFNPIVQQAASKSVLILSHAEALAELFNQKKGIAVCGVGGKSTTSAMITWILEQLHQSKPPQSPGTSYAVGVGDIKTLNRTGHWSESSPYFVAEADEYVTDPSAPSRNEPITPRFSFLRPWLIICTNIAFDHPDVYRDFEHTKATFLSFFQQLKPNGILIINQDDPNLVELAKQCLHLRPDIKLRSYALNQPADIHCRAFRVGQGTNIADLTVNNESHRLELPLPGVFNMANALATLAAVLETELPVTECIKSLAAFPSTKRRAEFIGEKKGVRFYDDYAHHPHEVKSIIQAYREWFPNNTLIVAFQSHTFSRTKALFSEFVDAFQGADEVVMIDIFPSAREAFDPSVSSESLCTAISAAHPEIPAHNYQTLPLLAQYLQTSLQPGNICLTLGAGDIYHLHEYL